MFVSWVARGVNLGTRINHGRQVPTPDVLHVRVRTRGFQRVLNGVDQATLHAEDNEDKAYTSSITSHSETLHDITIKYCKRRQ